MDTPLIQRPTSTGQKLPQEEQEESCCRVFVYPFAHAGRIQPFGIRRTVPELFLRTSGGVETETWREAWDQIDQAIGDQRTFRNKMWKVGLRSFPLIWLGVWLGGWTQELVCSIPVLGNPFLFDAGICFLDFWANPFLAFLFGMVYEACALYYLTKSILVLSKERDKALRGILDKIRYVCEDLNDSNDGTMYLWARVNFDLGMIAVDVYKSKPAAVEALRQMRNVPKELGDETSDEPIIETV